jgi:nicotinate-nucleotide adenylyltransferase
VTAIFGGRFDPPHLGHREAVRGLFEVPGVQKVIVVPSASPPHKPCNASAEHRETLAKICFTSTTSDPFPSEVTIDSREILRAQSAPPGTPSYSYDTLQELRPLIPNLAFVIGTDQFAHLPKWHRYPELLHLCHWIVLARKGMEDQDLLAQTLKDWTGSGLLRPISSNTWQIQSGQKILTVVPTLAQGHSSTLIRETIARVGSPPADSLLPDVLRYLKLHRLYGMKDTSL